MKAKPKPERIFARGSRTFSLAARLFPRRDRHDVAVLYVFCRYVDDLADDIRGGRPDALRGVRMALEGRDPGEADGPVAEFLRLAQNRCLPVEAALDLVEALEKDCGPRRLHTTDELVRYAYGVAGTVGLLMVPLLGVDDPRAAPFAVDLGIALQLTNIARDVGEDAGRSRFYLPEEWVAPERIEAAVIGGDAAAVRATEAAVRNLLCLGMRYYDSARRGHAFIPARNRRVIFLASVLYEEIGRTVLRSGPGAWRERIRLGSVGKGRAVLRACRAYRRYHNQDWSGSRLPRHDGSLHRPLHTATVRLAVTN